MEESLAGYSSGGGLSQQSFAAPGGGPEKVLHACWKVKFQGRMGRSWNQKEGLKPPVGIGPTLTWSVSAAGSSGPSGCLTQTKECFTFAQEGWSSVHVGSLMLRGCPVVGAPRAWVKGGAGSRRSPTWSSSHGVSRHSAGAPILQTQRRGHSCEAACSLTRHALGLSLGQAATGARRARCTN